MIPEHVYIVENGELVRYKRNGQCNRCGECCGLHNTIVYNKTISPTHPKETKEHKEGKDWGKYEGWSIFYAQGNWWYFKVVNIKDEPYPCPSQGETGACTIWKDEEDFKPICRYWPFHPDNLVKFPQCGFSFERCEDE